MQLVIPERQGSKSHHNEPYIKVFNEPNFHHMDEYMLLGWKGGG